MNLRLLHSVVLNSRIRIALLKTRDWMFIQKKKNNNNNEIYAASNLESTNDNVNPTKKKTDFWNI